MLAVGADVASPSLATTFREPGARRMLSWTLRAMAERATSGRSPAQAGFSTGFFYCVTRARERALQRVSSLASHAKGDLASLSGPGRGLTDEHVVLV
jgi:hypothetical protein